MLKPKGLPNNSPQILPFWILVYKEYKQVSKAGNLNPPCSHHQTSIEPRWAAASPVGD